MARVENALVTPNLKWKDEHATGWDAVGENTYVNRDVTIAKCRDEVEPPPNEGLLDRTVG
jgi:hypothetical protein